MFASSLLMPEAGICQLIPETELKTKNISIATVLKLEHYFVSMFSFRSKLLKVMGSDELSPLSVRNSETCFSMINLFGFILCYTFHFEVRLYNIFECCYCFQIIVFQI